MLGVRRQIDIVAQTELNPYKAAGNRVGLRSSNLKNNTEACRFIIPRILPTFDFHLIPNEKFLKTQKLFTILPV